MPVHNSEIAELLDRVADLRPNRPASFLRPNRKAHVTQLDYMRHGIGQPRRGWPEASDVLNTRTLPKLRTMLRAK
jgi:hypothetical protein